jgi:hypothetical protein
MWPPRRPCHISEGPQSKSRKIGGHGNCEVGHGKLTSQIKLLLIAYKKEIKIRNGKYI